ncbi:DUF262 domain-containing protein [Hymenobacter rubripertinctus]|uniref:DUF262 domain-containing protein n=1 Tax=Hymenobacter rubripertinctus TaxID=2029981 RepID=A0A418QLK7_9BACT|nr:DUF262 domain-containing protein [Hymenobacter rubripertinctus]RIY06018.1 DUF262 domain-containing protein [Hymenobacter rubripertinctus]
MDARYATPQKLFSGELQFIVPLFQRPYSWQLKQWKALWQDLLLLPEMEAGRNHFIGSVVMHPTNTVPTGVSKYAVIDGQQRLTTLFILLVALRDTAQAIDHQQLAERITDTYLTNKYAPAHERYKLLPTQADRPAFRQIADQAPGTAPVNSLVTDAFTYFRQQLQSWVRQQPTRAEEMFRLVLERLSLVSITLNDDDDPYLVFESLNAKGMQLTAADLIRNYLFMKIQPDQQDELNEQYWMPMQAALGDSLTVFIWHYLMRHGGNVPKSDVYQSFRKAVAGRAVPEVLAELARYAPTYARMLQPALETQYAAIGQALERLHRTRLTVAYPLIMRFYDQVRHGQMPQQTLLAVLDVLENYAMRGFMARRGTGGANKSMQTLASRTNGLDHAPETLLADIQSYLATQNYPADSDVLKALVEQPLYHHAGERRTRTKLLLDTLESKLSKKETVQLSKLSIEHIMPQTITPAWLVALGEQADRDHQQLLHTLGNLTLTGYNSELSNLPFAGKQVHFAASHVGLNAELATAFGWNGAAIRERSRRLAQLLVERWPSFAPNTADASLSGEGGRNASIRPTAVVLQGHRRAVSTWIEVVTATIELAATGRPQLWAQLQAAKPNYFSSQPQQLRSPATIAPAQFYEGHNNAKAHRLNCQFIVQQAGIAPAEWAVETAV